MQGESKERNVLKKRSDLKIRGCKDSYSLAIDSYRTVGFNLETSEKSRKALKLEQRRSRIF